ncbi:MAG: nuclear transport factor 2 family protein [Bryobacteraceae bacterium]|nr:nuclear transport factor 2 family protein [Bryobacteraceae bacterium]
MTLPEIANRLVQLCKAHQNFDAMQELYADSIVSVEAFAPPGGSHDTVGKPAVIQKSADWAAAHEIHSGTTEGPFVANGKFGVIFDFDVTEKATGQRKALREIAVYSVDGGKIVREEFLYSM